MAEVSVFRPGSVSYLRIAAPDVARSAVFYRSAFGWTTHEGAGRFEDATGHIIGHMILTGRAVGAAEAAAIGLANRVVPADQALTAAQELAARLASFPQICLRSDRASVLDQEGLDENAALASEFAHGRDALASEAASGAARFAAGAGRHGTFSP